MRQDLENTEARRRANADKDFGRRIRIGAGCDSRASLHGTYPWEGLVAHVAIYDRPITRQEVFAHWHAGAHPCRKSVVMKKLSNMSCQLCDCMIKMCVYWQWICWKQLVRMRL